jgi:hypothetical protein
MALSTQEMKFVNNWKVSIFNATRDCDLTLVRCVRRIIRIVMPNTSPPLDLAEHAKQPKISPEDKKALVMWSRLLDEVSREGIRELCLQLKRVCEEVFHSEGQPNAMLHGVWDGPSSSSSRESAAACKDVPQQQAVTQGAVGQPPGLGAPPAEGPDRSGGPPPEYFIRNEAGVVVAIRLWYGQRTVISHTLWRKMKAMWPVLSRTRDGQPYEEEREPWYSSAEAALQTIGNGVFTLDDLLEYLEECSPTDEQRALFRQFIAKDGGQMKVMVRLLVSIRESVSRLPVAHGDC